MRLTTKWGAASNEVLTGFTPNVLLREWQVRHFYRGVLALASQRSLRELAKQHTVLHVEAIPDENTPSNIGERRRLWAFSTREIRYERGPAEPADDP